MFFGIILSTIPSRYYWNCCWKLVNDYFEQYVFVQEPNHLILPCSTQQIFSSASVSRTAQAQTWKHWGGYTCLLARTWAARVKPSSWALCRAVRSLDYPTVASHPLKPKPDLQLIHTNRVLCWVLYFHVWAKGMRLAVSGLCQPSGIMGSESVASCGGLNCVFVSLPLNAHAIRVALTLLPTYATFLDIISINSMQNYET